jgi:Rrf2 family protein
VLFPNTVVYALRAMGWLALVPAGERVPSKDLSQVTHIPGHYLSKVMRRLVSAGLLSARKGHGGGFALARPPEQITIGEVLLAVDYRIEPETCAFGWGRCDSHEPCPLHPVWGRLKAAFTDWADTTTLAEVGTATDLAEIVVPD